MKTTVNIVSKVKGWINYFQTGVWEDSSKTAKVRIVKVLNLSVRSFLDRDLQSRSMSLTYSTVLAIVPAFALLLAIGRGFGLQDLLEQQLYQNFPAQRQFISLCLKFVDSYLKEASSGIFVGVGILFLLWTLISLLSYIESAFNMIWNIKHDRTLYQKITDYVAICLMVPILMICSSGASIFMSATVQDNMHFAFLTPFVNVLLELAPVFLGWIAFSLSFYLIPNTKVDVKYAVISGAISAVCFQILQLLFVNGQIYVSKYNAIYGSFAFLPLMLIWLQLSWLILLIGCVLTYSMQNVYGFNFIGDLTGLSENYERKLTVIIMSVVVERFRENKTPLSRDEISRDYDIPIRVVERIAEKLHKANVINFVAISQDKYGIAPATETMKLTVGEILKRMDNVGDQNFIPRFSVIYKDQLTKIDGWLAGSYKDMLAIPISEISVKPIDEADLAAAQQEKEAPEKGSEEAQKEKEEAPQDK